MRHFTIGLITVLLVSVSADAQPPTCQGGTLKFISNLTGVSYQWKIETDSGYFNVIDGTNYSGTNTKDLLISNIPSYWSGKKFLCLVDGNNSNQFTISISNEWTGSIDSLWENAVNWSCGFVPDIYTDVKVNNTTLNSVVINSNAVCRSLSLDSKSSLKVNPNFHLEIFLTQPTEKLSEEDLAILDSIPSIYVPLDSTFMEDGITSVKDFLNGITGRSQNFNQNEAPININGFQKKKFIAKMIEKGNYLMDDNNFLQYNPLQLHGLVYIPGGKNHEKPLQPTWGDCKNLGAKYYGLDCSGFIYQMVLNTGVKPKIPEDLFGVTAASDTANWNGAFRESEYNRLTMAEYSKEEVPVNLLQWGDIISWGGNHIGLYVGVVAPVIYQSNGSFNLPECENGYNRDEKHGPNMKPLIGTKDEKWIEKLMKGNYKVLRVIEGFFDERDNQIYLAKKIGKQIWMERNLNYAYTGSYCYENTSLYCDIYGRIYDWNQAKAAVPVGWHLPTDAEWEELVTFLGGATIAGGSMKREGTSFWTTPNKGATNNSGFNGLPGGNRNTFGTNFANLGIRGFWWSSTINPSNTSQAFNRVLDNESTSVGRGSANRADGRTHFSVRLIKDN